jgi:osmoprotectant transport system permease protein
METIQGLLEWFGEAEQMSGSGAIPVRVLEHLQLTLSAVAAAMIPAVGLGIYIGHSRRFEFITITVANLGRALPSFAILAFFFPISLQLGLGLGFWPTFIALFFLAIPPILTNAYVGIKEVDRDAVESATGMGMSGTEVLRSIEIPLAMPLIITGIRTSAVQVIATATLAALVAGGGLGRYIVDGFAVGDTAEIQSLLSALSNEPLPPELHLPQGTHPSFLRSRFPGRGSREPLLELTYGLKRTHLVHLRP